MKRRLLFPLTLVFLCLRTLAADDEKIPGLLPPHVEIQLTFWQAHGWQCILAGVLFIGIVAFVILLLRRPPATVSESPAVQARHALERLRGQPEDGALIVNVSRILKRYVITFLRLPPEELTTTEFRQTLEHNSEVPSELAATTADFLKRCDEWKFAPERPANNLGAVDGALELVDKLQAGWLPPIYPDAVVNRVPPR